MGRGARGLVECLAAGVEPVPEQAAHQIAGAAAAAFNLPLLQLDIKAVEEPGNTVVGEAAFAEDLDFAPEKVDYLGAGKALLVRAGCVTKFTCSPQDRLPPRIEASLQLRMNGLSGVVEACPLRVFARAQPAGNEFLLNAAALDRFTDRGLDQVGECLANAKDALGGLTQLGLDAQGREG